jgi:Tol biopolymer transport system component
LSPDGTRAVLDIRDQQNDLWLWDGSRPTLTRLTFDAGTEYYPVWTPDGQRVAFYSAGQGGNIFWKRVDGIGAAERLTSGQTIPHYPYAISSDGRSLVFQESTKTGVDLSVLSLPVRTTPAPQVQADPDGASQGSVRPLIHTEFIDTNAEISPDGRWVAYQSNRSGDRDEIFVQPFPNVAGGLQQVSTAGGTRPLWSRDGRELFYLDGNNLLTVARVQTTPTFSVIGVETLFKTAYFSGFGGGGQTVAGRTYDVSPDGRRFLMIKDVNRDQQQASLVVVQNLFEELKRLVP